MRFIALFICLSIVGISGITRAQQKDTIRVSNFGAHPYTYENCVTCLQEAISECKRSGARVLLIFEERALMISGPKVLSGGKYFYIEYIDRTRVSFQSENYRSAV